MAVTGRRTNVCAPDGQVPRRTRTPANGTTTAVPNRPGLDLRVVEALKAEPRPTEPSPATLAGARPTFAQRAGAWLRRAGSSVTAGAGDRCRRMGVARA